MKKSTRRTQLLMILGAIVFYTAMQHLNQVANAIQWFFGVSQQIIAGLCIAFILNIPMTLIEDKVLIGKKPWMKKLRRPLSMVLSCALALGLLALLLGVVLPQLTETVNLLISKFPDYVKSISQWAAEMLEKIHISDSLEAEMQQILDALWRELLAFLKKSSAVLAGSALNLTASILSGVFNAILSMAIALYVLSQKESIGRLAARAVKAYLPLKTGARVYRISRLSYRAFSNFIKGQLTESLLLGFLCFLGAAIFRFPSPGVIGLMVGVLAIVPVIGPWTGAILSGFVVLILAPQKILGFIIFMVILTQIEDNVIYPRVVGNTMGLPGLLVLMAVVIGVNVYGIMGILLSVPLCSVFYGLLKEGIDERLKRKSGAAGMQAAEMASATEDAEPFEEMEK